MPDWRAYVGERLPLPALRAEREAEIVEDLAQQLDEAYRAALARGASAADAEIAAQREIQDWDSLGRAISASDTRHRRALDERVIDRLESATSAAADGARPARLTLIASQFAADLVHAVRLLRKAPGFTTAVLVTLALGIGANAAVFTILNAVLLRPLPYSDPERLVALWENNPQRGWPQFAVSQPTFLDWREQSVSFERLTAMVPRPLNLTGGGASAGGGAERIPGAAVTHDWLMMLGVRPALGRGFLPEEDTPGRGEPVAIMTRGLWQRRFAADPGIIGRAITLDDVPHTVVGVVPEFYWRPYEIFVPLRPDPAEERDDHWLSVYGKLKPGVALEQARVELAGVAERIARQYPASNAGWTVTLSSFYDWVVPQGSRRTLWVLLGAVALVLLIACANVANLLLARATGRRREIAIRAALGASRGRLVRQLLAESLLLAVLGGGLGLLVARWGIDALGVAAVSALPRGDEISLDQRVLLFTLAVSLVTGILFGLVPALQAARVDFHGTLKEGAAGGAVRQRSRSALVVAEVALSLILLAGVGLLVRSLVALLDAPPGFEARGLLIASINLPGARYPSAKEYLPFHDRLLERLRALPGVTSASLASSVPLGGDATAMEVHPIGAPAPADGAQPSAQWQLVSPGYFRTLGIPIRSGRDLNEHDLAPETRTMRGAVISEGLARRCWPGQDPIGRQFHPWSTDNPPITVVGVAADVRYYSLDQEPPPVVYLDFHVGRWNPMYIVLRTAGDARSLAGALRGEVRAMDPGVPLAGVRTMDDLVDQSTAPRRFTMTLLAIFAAVALLLAAVGLFGLMACLVAQRTHDIGVRMALGARRRHIFGLVVGRAMLLTSIGIAAGVAGALGLTRILSSMLFGVGARDPLTLIATAVLLAAVAMAACWVPARRAARVDPMVALRCE
ncbi:MAG: ABC transporter permease [Candidatus Polarisedimenticolia bacterium]